MKAKELLVIIFLLFAASCHSSGKQNATAPSYLYRVVSIDEWQQSQRENRVVPSAMDAEFFHLSTQEQLPQILHKFWSDRDCVVLKLDTSQLEGRLVYETNPGGTTRYYHLYEGKIPLKAVVEADTVYRKSA